MRTENLEKKEVNKSEELKFQSMGLKRNNGENRS